MERELIVKRKKKKQRERERETEGRTIEGWGGVCTHGEVASREWRLTER